MRVPALLWLGVGVGVSAAIQEAEPGQFPYTVSLQVRLYGGKCQQIRMSREELTLSFQSHQRCDRQT